MKKPYKSNIGKQCQRQNQTRNEVIQVLPAKTYGAHGVVIRVGIVGMVNKHPLRTYDTYYKYVKRQYAVKTGKSHRFIIDFKPRSPGTF